MQNDRLVSIMAFDDTRPAVLAEVERPPTRQPRFDLLWRPQADSHAGIDDIHRERPLAKAGVAAGDQAVAGRVKGDVRCPADRQVSDLSAALQIPKS